MVQMFSKVDSGETKGSKKKNNPVFLAMYSFDIFINKHATRYFLLCIHLIYLLINMQSDHLVYRKIKRSILNKHAI
jgi:hypothetical protein